MSPYLRPVLLLVLLLAGCATPAAQAPAPRAPVILVSIDGFHPNYLERGLTPTLNAMAAEGVRAPAMRPSFPTKTFPNHYTLVTGLRPDRHGIVDNTMEDPALPGRFRVRDKDKVTDRRWWDDAEPLWVTAKRQGLRTATMFWPGSEAAISGLRPDEWRPYDAAVSATARVDAVLGWLDAPVSPDFVTLYFDTVDSAGHRHGPEAAETDRAIAEVDAALARLRAGLRARGLEANLVVVSDHGMAATSSARVIVIEDIVDASKIRLVTDEAVAGVQPGPGFDAITERKLLAPRPHHRCYRKAELPARLAYGRHRRVPAIICIADPGWLILSRADAASMPAAGGDHGYENGHPSMEAVFLAAGPSFRRGAVTPVFDNVDVYPLLARLLGVRPMPHDGDLRELGPALVRGR